MPLFEEEDEKIPESMKLFLVTRNNKNIREFVGLRVAENEKSLRSSMVDKDVDVIEISSVENHKVLIMETVYTQKEDPKGLRSELSRFYNELGKISGWNGGGGGGKKHHHHNNNNNHKRR